ncbi:hypothetical protein GCM10023083_35550 [Streptomyces phyllanthi]
MRRYRVEYVAIEDARAAVDLHGEADDALLPFLAEEPFRRSATCSTRRATRVLPATEGRNLVAREVATRAQEADGWRY